MSRRCGLLAPFLASAMVMPALAQDVSAEDRAIARDLMGRQGRLAPPVRPRCEAPQGDDIVVCAQDNEQFRAERSTGGTDDGRLTPPSFEPKNTGTVVGRGCFIPPCPPETAYMIDLSTIPMAPAGSDADRIAKGEMRGR